MPLDIKKRAATNVAKGNDSTRPGHTHSRFAVLDQALRTSAEERSISIGRVS
jgi:hypothetical protein